MNNSRFSAEELKGALKWRYATKVFDRTKKIPAEVWGALEEALVLSPSSFGLQPWKFIEVKSPELREKLKEVSWGQGQIVDASHLMVFAVRTTVDEKFVDHYVDRTSEVAGVSKESLSKYRDMMVQGINAKRAGGELRAWASRQVYIALGGFMTAAAALGVDTCPMEGIDPAKYDELLGLKGKGFETLVVCAAGYRSTEDKYAEKAKVRFEKGEVLEER